jgi:hypothetical protein
MRLAVEQQLLEAHFLRLTSGEVQQQPTERESEL